MSCRVRFGHGGPYPWADGGAETSAGPGRTRQRPDGGYLNANMDFAGGSLLKYDSKTGQFSADFDALVKDIGKNVSKENYKNDEDWAKAMAGLADLFSGAQGTAFSGWMNSLGEKADDGTNQASAGASWIWDYELGEVASGAVTTVGNLLNNAWVNGTGWVSDQAGAVVDAVASGASWLWNTVSAPFVAAGQWVAGQWNDFSQWAGNQVESDPSDGLFFSLKPPRLFASDAQVVTARALTARDSSGQHEDNDLRKEIRSDVVDKILDDADAVRALAERAQKAEDRTEEAVELYFDRVAAREQAEKGLRDIQSTISVLRSQLELAEDGPPYDNPDDPDGLRRPSFDQDPAKIAQLKAQLEGARISEGHLFDAFKKAQAAERAQELAANAASESEAIERGPYDMLTRPLKLGETERDRRNAITIAMQKEICYVRHIWVVRSMAGDETRSFGEYYREALVSGNIGGPTATTGGMPVYGPGGAGSLSGGMVSLAKNGGKPLTAAQIEAVEASPARFGGAYDGGHYFNWYRRSDGVIISLDNRKNMGYGEPLRYERVRSIYGR